MRLLAPLHAEDIITNDLRLVGKLIDKLPEHLQVEWSRKATELGRQIQPGTTEWPKFMSLLNQEREAAQLSAITRQDHIC